MGCSGLGNLYRRMEEAAAIATVHRALELGVRYFDVAPHYGFGLAERRLGKALAGRPRRDLVISTKVGRRLVATDQTGERHGFVDADPFEPVFDYGGEAVVASHRQSLERLGLDRVDVLLAHDLGEATHGADAEAHLAAFLDSGYAAMRGLKAAGKVGMIGLGVNEVAICERLMDEVELDVILLAGRYTLLEQGALALLDRCAAEGVRVIVGGPFNSGLLVESAKGPRHYNYDPAPDDILARAEALAEVCRAHNTPLAAAALAFPGAHPAVSTVLAGLADPLQVEEVLGWRVMAPSPDLWRALRAASLVDAGAPTPA
jgi:D-threo-aldose 1-dehydrogenase